MKSNGLVALGGILLSILFGISTILISNKTMEATVAERYHVTDFFPFDTSIGIISALQENGPFRVILKNRVDLRIYYDAPLESKMWLEGNELHLVKGYRIGANRSLP